MLGKSLFLTLAIATALVLGGGAVWAAPDTTFTGHAADKKARRN